MIYDFESPPEDPELRRLWKISNHAQVYGISQERFQEILVAAERRNRQLILRNRVLRVAAVLAILGAGYLAYYFVGHYHGLQ